jgi:hypothetical protein
MIRSYSYNQLTLPEFDWSFQAALNGKNRWVRLSRLIPWDAFSEPYCQKLSVTQGRPAKDARLVIGAVIIKHKLCLSDEETVCQIHENPYLQYFVGLPGYQMKAPLRPRYWSKFESEWDRAFLIDSMKRSLSSLTRSSRGTCRTLATMMTIQIIKIRHQQKKGANRRTKEN